MGLTRRYFIQVLTTSTIGLSLLRIFQKPSSSRENESLKENDAANGASPTEKHVSLNGAKSVLEKLPLLYDL